MKLDELLTRIAGVVASHRLEDGSYARWLWQDDRGSRALGCNEYGCADAANILYSLGQFPTGDAAAALLDALLAMQEPETGLFRESTHHPIHTTAHCTAALELFDRKPRLPLRALEPYFTPEGLVTLLEGLRWEDSPWNNSHQGAGIYAAGVLTGSVDQDWQERYFRWIWENTDETFGISRRGAIQTGRDLPCHHLYGWFHYLFNLEYAKMPMRYPERLVDTCLALWKDRALTAGFGRSVGFMEVDWVFALNRAIRQTTHRFAEAKDALGEMAEGYIPYLCSLDPQRDEGMNDLHMLFGAVCALAELQAALPGAWSSARPLRLVLNRRPFI